MHTITKFGDLAVLLPLSLTLGITLWRWETRRAAGAFMLALLACLVIMGLLKLFFLSCGPGRTPEMLSPSGHAAASTFVFASLALVVHTQTAARWRALFIVFAATAIFSIAISRVAIGAHSVPEVITGFLVGSLCFTFFAFQYRILPHPRFNIGMFGALMLLLAISLHGANLPVEKLLQKWSGTLRTQTALCGSAPHPAEFF